MLTLPRISRHQMKDTGSSPSRVEGRVDVASLGYSPSAKGGTFSLSLSMPGRSARPVIGQAIGPLTNKDQHEAAQRDCLTVVP